MQNNHSGSQKSGRRVLIVLCAVLGVVLAILLGLTVYAEHLLGRLNYVDPDGTRPSMSQEEIDAILNGDGETLDPDYTGPNISGEDVELATAGVEIGEEDNIVNILLIGADYQDTDRPRSDSTILVTFNKETQKLTMTSFMRDLYIKIPGYSKNKLNAAYSLGGMSLLQETLNVNFGVHADGVVEVDFNQFTKIIDLLGGVTLDLTSKEAEFINKKSGSSLGSGVQHLTGSEAVWFARYRDPIRGDFDRTNRQRTLLNTLIETYKSASLYTILSMMNDILPLITTNMTKEEIVDYVVELFPLLMDADIVMQRIPIDGEYDMTSVDGISVLIPDIEANVQFLLDTIGTDAE